MALRLRHWPRELVSLLWQRRLRRTSMVISYARSPGTSPDLDTLFGLHLGGKIVDPRFARIHISTFDDHPFRWVLLRLGRNDAGPWKISVYGFRKAIYWGALLNVISAGWSSLMSIDTMDCLPITCNWWLLNPPTMIDFSWIDMNYGVLNDRPVLLSTSGRSPETDYPVVATPTGVTFEMTFVPAPAGGLLLLGACTRRRRRN